MPQANYLSNGELEFKNVNELGNLKGYRVFDCTPEGANEKDLHTYRELNEFIINDSINSSKANLTQTFVLVQGDIILGYCTLFSNSIVLGGKYRKRKGVTAISRLRAYPTVSIMYFCVNNEFQGQSIGKLLMSYVYETMYQLSFFVGITLIEVTALESASVFYKKQGFELYGAHRSSKNMEALAITTTEIKEILS